MEAQLSGSDASADENDSSGDAGSLVDFVVDDNEVESEDGQTVYNFNEGTNTRTIVDEEFANLISNLRVETGRNTPKIIPRTPGVSNMEEEEHDLDTAAVETEANKFGDQAGDWEEPRSVKKAKRQQQKRARTCS